MVSKKSIYYGRFDCFEAPVVPRAPRSLRRRSLRRKSSEDSEICAFELLAAVAGKLLQESESSTSSTRPEGKEEIGIPKDYVKQDNLEVKVKPVRSEYLDQGSCAESGFVPKPANLKLKLEPPSKESPLSDDDSGLEHTSSVTTSGFLKKVGNNVKSETSEGKNVVNVTPSKPEENAPSHGDLREIQTGVVEKQSGDVTCDFRESVEKCVNTRVLRKSYSSVHLPFHRDRVPSAYFPRHRGNVKIGLRDDDENSFRCHHHGMKMRAFRSQSRTGYRRIRKMLNSRYWKSAPKLRDYELANTASRGVKPFYQNKKSIYMRDRCQAEAASKRRKLFHHGSKTAYEARGECISKLPDKIVRGDKKRPHSVLNKGMASSIIGHKGSFQSKDSHVKFSINSFKVPELYVEVPETSTVGSLKRTVLEAVTAILGGDLRVGILFQGKKVRDNNRTLQQSGISQNCDLENLGFTLEPSFPQPSPPPIQNEPPLLLSCDNHQQLSRSPESPILDVGFPNSTSDSPPATSLDCHVEKNQEIIPFTAEGSAEERVADSKALVPVPAVKAEALSIVPAGHKPTKRSELSQRRIRRPFSVSEVEALVESVETLGTGRWRDVKLRAFDDANHRTYVDLKDKWKTLVHTASIAAQQRRGEPVPQDLLDRVLVAHAFWSQQHGKPQSEPLQASGDPNVKFVEPRDPLGDVQSSG